MYGTLAAALPAFLASLVEFVEALTIVLAVGATRGWRSALAGTAAASLALAVVVLTVGPALVRVPLALLQLVVGVLLLFFGMRWLRKAVLRYAGAVPLHDETRIYSKRRGALAAHAAAPGETLDMLGFGTAFQAVALEGLEVVFIVIAVGGAAGSLAAAAFGAALAGALVVACGIALRRPLARVPENSLKFAVGLLLSSFGTFWTGEGLGVVWPAGDAGLVVLLAGFALASGLAYAAAVRRTHGRRIRGSLAEPS